MGWHLVLLPDSIILQLPLFTSCAADMLICPVLVAVLLEMLDNGDLPGHRKLRLLIPLAIILLVLTVYILLPW